MSISVSLWFCSIQLILYSFMGLFKCTIRSCKYWMWVFGRMVDDTENYLIKWKLIKFRTACFEIGTNMKTTFSIFLKYLSDIKIKNPFFVAPIDDTDGKTSTSIQVRNRFDRNTFVNKAKTTTRTAEWMKSKSKSKKNCAFHVLCAKCSFPTNSHSYRTECVRWFQSAIGFLFFFACFLSPHRFIDRLTHRIV